MRLQGLSRTAAADVKMKLFLLGTCARQFLFLTGPHWVLAARTEHRELGKFTNTEQ